RSSFSSKTGLPSRLGRRLESLPIIEPPDPQLPLSQGDVLKDVRLFFTKETWSEAGGEAGRLAQELCMVVSRPCCVAHKAMAIVAAVEKFSNRVPKDFQTFEDIRNFLTDLRDAPDAPDIFYLGQLPNYDGRYGAKLDSLHTIQLPPDEDTLRQFTA